MAKKNVNTIKDILKAMQEDKAVRRTIARRSFKFFFLFYFVHYMDFPFAAFHDEIFELAQNDTHSMFVLSAFRNSGKSTILSLAYVLWCIINGRAKYVLILSENLQKAQTLLGHMREELEREGLLRRDLGPFRAEGGSWNTSALTVDHYNAKIAAFSTEQSVRGLRHGTHRPDLIVIDDCESNDSVRTLEQRDKLSKWLGSDVIPAGHTKTKVIVIGSMLHPDSLIPRLQKRINEGKITGTYRVYPILDEDGNPTWPEKYHDREAVESEKSRGISERDWIIEFLCHPFVEDDQIVRSEHIRYYDTLPEHVDHTYLAVDPAFTDSERNDFTAIVAGSVVQESSTWYLAILPYPVNMKGVGSEITERIMQESLRLGSGRPAPIVIEDVQAQRFIIDFLSHEGFPVEGISPGGKDKRARLNSTSEFIKMKVRFPRYGCEKLINQLVYFGMGNGHDDLVDALVYLVMKVHEEMTRNRLYFPAPETPKAAPSRQEAEALEDKGQRLLSEARRSGDPNKWQAYQQWHAKDQQRRPEYAAERQRFNSEMHRRQF